MRPSETSAVSACYGRLLKCNSMAAAKPFLIATHRGLQLDVFAYSGRHHRAIDCQDQCLVHVLQKASAVTVGATDPLDAQLRTWAPCVHGPMPQLEDSMPKGVLTWP